MLSVLLERLVFNGFFPLATCHAISFCIFLQDSAFICLTHQPAKVPYVFGRLFGRAMRGACCMSNCFLEVQFVSHVFTFFREKLPKCLELSCVSLTFVAPKIRTSSKLPPLMVRCTEDRLARGGEGRRSILLTNHYVVQLHILRPDSRASNGSMVQHFIGGVWYCGILGSENGTFSARFQFLLVFQCLSCCHTRLNSTRRH